MKSQSHLTYIYPGNPQLGKNQQKVDFINYKILGSILGIMAH